MLKSSAFRLNIINYNRRFASRNVKVYKFLPAPIKQNNGSKDPKLPPITKIDDATIDILERISLVGLENEKGIQILEEAIKFAHQIFEVDTSKAKPLVTVLENQSLYLREDEPKTDLTRSELLSHAEVSTENYFVTPSRNPNFVSTETVKEIPNLKICKN